MAVTRFAQNGLVRLGYEVQGEGSQPVLLLHGLLQDRVALRPLADALQGTFTVISMDLRGHGGSSAIHGVDLTIADLVGDVVAVLDAAEINQPVAVVGVELGAIVADGLQEMDPTRVRGVVRANYPDTAMLDPETLSGIATRAYREQVEQALTSWLNLGWGEGWQDSVPKPRIAAARRSAGAIHPVLTALASASLAPRESLRLPGGVPFADEDDIDSVITALNQVMAVS